MLRDGGILVDLVLEGSTNGQLPMFSQHCNVDRRFQLFWRIASAMRHRRMKARELAYALDDLRMVQTDAAPPLQFRIRELHSLTAR